MQEKAIIRALVALDVGNISISGDWVMGYCPFAPYKHSKATDSGTNFGVHVEDDGISFYNCLSCKSKGTLSGLAFQLATLRDDDTLREFARKLELEEITGGSLEYGEWEEDTNTKKTKKLTVTNFPDERGFYQQYRSVLNFPRALRYLRRRGIYPSTSVALGLRYDAEQARILFPVHDEFTGRFAGCSGRSVESASVLRDREAYTGIPQPKVRDYGGLQKDRLLLGTRRISRRNWSARGVQHRASKQRSPIIVVEGLFAYARVRQLRPDHTAYALLGSALTPGKENIFRELDCPIIWMVDGDAAGKACLYGNLDPETLEHSPETGALHKLYNDVAQFTVEYPEGKDDPDQLTLAELNAMIDGAEIYIK